MKEDEVLKRIKQLAKEGIINQLPRDKKLYKAVEYRSSLDHITIGEYIKRYACVEFYSGRETRKGMVYKGTLAEKLPPSTLFYLKETKKLTSKEIAGIYGTTRQNIDRLYHSYNNRVN